MSAYADKARVRSLTIKFQSHGRASGPKGDCTSYATSNRGYLASMKLKPPPARRTSRFGQTVWSVGNPPVAICSFKNSEGREYGNCEHDPRGQPSRTLLNREYPHQVLVPSWKRGKMFEKIDAFHAQIGAPMKERSIYKIDSWHELYCFAEG